jgi:N6-L-threonylcarbamoyladenine synthase
VTVLCLFVSQVVQKALDDANLSGSDLSAVSVTIGPGLGLCLRGIVSRLLFILRPFHHCGLLKCPLV